MDDEGVKRHCVMLSKQNYAVKKQGDWYYYSKGHVDSHSVDELRDMAIYNR